MLSFTTVISLIATAQSALASPNSPETTTSVSLTTSDSEETSAGNLYNSDKVQLTLSQGLEAHLTWTCPSGPGQHTFKWIATTDSAMRQVTLTSLLNVDQFIGLKLKDKWFDAGWTHGYCEHPKRTEACEYRISGMTHGSLGPFGISMRMTPFSDHGPDNPKIHQVCTSVAASSKSDYCPKQHSTLTECKLTSLTVHVIR
jgi:hypothetical protein